MNELFRRSLMLCVISACAVVGVTASAQAITITPAGEAFTGNLVAGTNAVFTDSFTGLTVLCTVHTAKATTANPASDASQLPAGASNVYSTAGGASCTYTGFGSGTATVATTATWTLKATGVGGGVATGSITVPNSAATIKLAGSLNCTITVNSSTVKMKLTNGNDAPTKVNSKIQTDGANSVATSGCLTTPTPTQTEALEVVAATTNKAILVT